MNAFQKIIVYRPIRETNITVETVAQTDRIIETFAERVQALILTEEEAVLLRRNLYNALYPAKKVDCTFKTNNDVYKMMEYAASIFGVAVKDLGNKSRKRELVIARQMVMTLLKVDNFAKLATIGGFVNKDHATVLHAHTTIQNYIDTKDKVYYKQIKQVIDYYDLGTKFNITA